MSDSTLDDEPGQGATAPSSRDASEINPASEDAESTPEANQEEDDELQKLRRDFDALNDRHLRLAAEYENYRRRSQTELGESAIRAQAALVGTLLDTLDDLERVTSLDPESASVESVLEGVALVERKVHRLLEDAGLEPLEPEGERFDPAEMEAMARVPANTSDEDDTVADVFQRGFRFKGHLIRPARVSVRMHD